jgi:hypothetical protein
MTRLVSLLLDVFYSDVSRNIPMFTAQPIGCYYLSMSVFNVAFQTQVLFLCEMKNVAFAASLSQKL